MKAIVLSALATATLAVFAFASTGQAKAALLSLECQDTLVAAQNRALTMRIWIDLDHSWAVTAFNLRDGPGSSYFTYFGPDPVSIAPRQFVVQNRTVTIDRLSGNGNESTNSLSCTKRDLPYPADAPNLTPKF